MQNGECGRSIRAKAAARISIADPARRSSLSDFRLLWIRFFLRQFLLSILFSRSCRNPMRCSSPWVRGASSNYWIRSLQDARISLVKKTYPEMISAAAHTQRRTTPRITKRTAEQDRQQKLTKKKTYPKQSE